MKVIKKAPRVFHAKNVRMYLKNADGTETDIHMFTEAELTFSVGHEPIVLGKPQVDVYDGRSRK